MCWKKIYVNVDSKIQGLKLKEYGVHKRGTLYHILCTVCASVSVGAALSWKWHESPWPGARCPPGPPASVGSLSQPLVWRHDWLGTPPARPSSGCPVALESFPFSDPPGAPSETPSQTCQSTGKKIQIVSKWLECEKECVCAHVISFNLLSALMTTNGKGWWMCLWLESMTFYQLRFFKMSSPFVFGQASAWVIWPPLFCLFLFHWHFFTGDVLCK